MGLLSALADAIYREYDRRIKRASVITEYGANHHADHAPADHAPDHASEPEAEIEDEAEIVNLPRGTPVAMPPPAPEADEPA